MQLYTKIFLGMLVGSVVGLTLGPRSPWLSKDMFLVSSDHAELFVLLNDDLKLLNPVSLPPGESLRLRLLEEGQNREDLFAAKVALRVDDRLALKALASLEEALGRPVSVGEHVELWLKLHRSTLDECPTLFPKPVSGLGDQIVSTLRPVGTLFIRLINMVIVPLVFSSLLVGVASLGDVRKLGRMGGRTLMLYMLTTAVAVSLGVGLANLVNPGRFVGSCAQSMLRSAYESAATAKANVAGNTPSTLNNILDIIPKNPIASMADGNMLQVIFFAGFFGVALTLLSQEQRCPVVEFFDRVQQAMIVVIHLVMELAPYGVAALLADVVGASGLSLLGALSVYALVVLFGLFLHAGLIYGSLVRFLARLPLNGFLRAARPAQLVAFSTSSSSAALPVTMTCAEENMGVSRSVSSFVLPLGSTVNMDGTALYQGVAAIFVAQVFQVDLSLSQQVGIILAATLASIGAAGVPGAGIVTLALVLTSAGIPAVGIALILGMDRLLDMFRTVVNVTGDLAVTTSVAALEGEQLNVATRATTNNSAHRR